MNIDQINSFASYRIERLRGFIKDDPAMEESLASTLREYEAILNGTLVHVEDERWSREAAFPVVGKFSLDGWEFTFRGHNPLYQRPSNGDEDWLVAKLVNFKQGKGYTRCEGRCVYCGSLTDAGLIELMTPSGRTFRTTYRAGCKCSQTRHATGFQLELRLNDAMNVLLDYLMADPHREELAAVAGAIYRHEEGSFGRLKRVFGLIAEIKVPTYEETYPFHVVRDTFPNGEVRIMCSECLDNADLVNVHVSVRQKIDVAAELVERLVDAEVHGSRGKDCEHATAAAQKK